MSLPTSNITTAAIATEIGSGSNVVSTLVGASGLNPYSYYAPGALSVDASKNIVLTPPVSNYKLGDYRGYDSAAFKPHIQTPTGWIGWYGSTKQFPLPYWLESLNLYAFANTTYYVRFNFYVTAATRITETSPILNDDGTLNVFPIVFNSDTPLVGHSRQSAYRCQVGQGMNPPTTQNSGAKNMLTAWLSTSTDTPVYVDVFICDSGGTRLINFGTSRSDGYVTLTMHYQATPYGYGKNNNIPVPPYGYTYVFPAVYGAATPVCSFGTNLNQSIGSAYDFYVVAKALYGGSDRVVEITSAHIVLTIDGNVAVREPATSLSYTSGYHFFGTFTGGVSWAAGSVGAITFEDVTTIAATPNYTSC